MFDKEKYEEFIATLPKKEDGTVNVGALTSIQLFNYNQFEMQRKMKEEQEKAELNYAKAIKKTIENYEKEEKRLIASNEQLIKKTEALEKEKKKNRDIQIKMAKLKDEWIQVNNQLGKDKVAELLAMIAKQEESKKEDKVALNIRGLRPDVEETKENQSE